MCATRQEVWWEAYSLPSPTPAHPTPCPPPPTPPSPPKNPALHPLQAAQEAVKYALQHWLYAGAAAAAAGPMALVSLSQMADSAWALALDRAVKALGGRGVGWGLGGGRGVDFGAAGGLPRPFTPTLRRSHPPAPHPPSHRQAGRLLAHVLAAGAHGGRPVTLVAFSMGARLAFHCLLELVRLGALGEGEGPVGLGGGGAVNGLGRAGRGSGRGARAAAAAPPATPTPPQPSLFPCRRD